MSWVSQLAAATLLLGASATPSPAQSLGPLPWCFSTSPFADVLILRPLVAGGAQSQGPGRDLAGDRAMAVSAIADTDTVTIGFTIYPRPGFAPVSAGATVTVRSGTGAGQCFTEDGFDCGALTLRKIACPGSRAGSPPVFAVPGAASERVMGRRG